MNTNSQPQNIADLLPHREALRRLVRGIVHDDHDAEDLVQEAALVALQKGDSDVSANPGWLRGAAKHLAWRHLRAENRRRAREAQAAQPALATTSNDVTTRVESLKGVLDALLTLPKAQREVVSFRYLDGLPPRKIAKRLNEPLETIKTRLKRGLRSLREKLDEQHDGNRGAWLALLIPFAPASAVAGTAAATATWLQSHAAAVVLVGAATIGGWYVLQDRNVNLPTEATATAAPRSLPIPGADVPDRPAGSALQSVPFNPEVDALSPKPLLAPPSAAPKRKSGPTATGSITARIRFRNGKPAVGARLVVANAETRRQQDCDSQGKARFEITLTEPSFSPTEVQIIWHHHVVRLTQSIPRYFDPVQLADTWEIVLPNPALVTGLMVDEQGQPVPGMGLSLASTGPRRGSGGSFSSASVLSDPSGRFSLEVPFEGPLQLMITPKLSPSSSARSRPRTLALTTRPADDELAELGVIPLPLHPEGLWASGATQLLSLSSGETADLGRLLVARPGQIQIVLSHGLTGAAVAGRWLRITCPTRQVNLLAGPTDEQGRASLPFAPGTHRLQVAIIGEGKIAPASPCTVRPEGSVLHELRLFDRSEDMTTERRSLTVIVTSQNGKALPFAHVSWSDQSGLTSSKGLLTFSFLEGESGPLEIRHKDYITKRIASFQPGEHTTQKAFALKVAATSRLRVFDANGILMKSIRITPMAKAPLLYGLPWRSSLRDQENAHRMTWRDEKAQFDTIIVRGLDQGIAELPLRSLLNRDEIVEVTLRNTAIIDVTVEDEHGRPQSGVTLWSGSRSLPIDLRRTQRLIAEESGRWFEDRTITDAAGRARLRVELEGAAVCALTDPANLAMSRGVHSMVTDLNAPLRLVVPGPTHLVLNRGGPSPVIQSVHAVLKHPAIRLWRLQSWPARTSSFKMLAPLRGLWHLQVAQEVDGQRRWRGKTFAGLLDAADGYARREF